MTEQNFVQGWSRLCAAFDVKKSAEHMRIVFESVRAFDARSWPIAVENLIKQETVFPKIATIRQALFDIANERGGSNNVATGSPLLERIAADWFKAYWASLPPPSEKAKQIKKELMEMLERTNGELPLVTFEKSSDNGLENVQF